MAQVRYPFARKHDKLNVYGDFDKHRQKIRAIFLHILLDTIPGSTLRDSGRKPKKRTPRQEIFWGAVSAPAAIPNRPALFPSGPHHALQQRSAPDRPVRAGREVATGKGLPHATCSNSPAKVFYPPEARPSVLRGKSPFPFRQFRYHESREANTLVSLSLMGEGRGEGSWPWRECFRGPRWHECHDRLR